VAAPAGVLAASELICGLVVARVNVNDFAHRSAPPRADGGVLQTGKRYI
jgi:hypothetical protein